jgi:uncharacterized protein YjbI with pentapeptide repeats
MSTDSRAAFTGNRAILAILEAALAAGDVQAWNDWKRAKDDWVPRLDSSEEPPGDPGEIDLSGLALPGADLRDIDLRGVSLRGASLCGADLSRANLKFATLDGADLRACKLTGANLWGTSFVDADLRGADLSDTKCVDGWTAPDMSAARYGETTTFPPNLDPIERGMRRTT